MVTNRLKISFEDRKKISHEIAHAEAGTSGEIVPVIVGRSNAYSDVSWRVGFGFSLLVAFALYLIFPELNPASYLWSEIPALLLGLWLGSLPKVQKFFLHQDRMEHEVKNRAIQAFFSHNLTSTRDRNGILILISVLERRVELIADSGIHSKVSDGTWDHLVKQLTEKFRDGKVVHGLSEAVAACGTLLKKNFPVASASDHVHELANELSIED